MLDPTSGDQDWKALDGGATGGKQPRRNQTCRCGSGNKYKRCCLERDQAFCRQRRCAVMPAWILKSDRKLHQFEKYVCKDRKSTRLNSSHRTSSYAVFCLK